jgi:hypothetical protein
MAGSAKKRKTWRKGHEPSEFRRDVPANGRSNIDTIAIKDFADLPSSKLIVPIRDGRQDFRTLTWRCLSVAKPIDKRAGRIMIAEFRRLYFGERKRLTKQRCEAFFSNDANFISI